MLRTSVVVLFTATIVQLCGAFSPALPLATRAVTRSAPGICSVRASAAEEGILGRRSFLAAGFALATGALIPNTPAFAETAVQSKAISGNYVDGEVEKCTP
jgi:hypothetical protein